MNKIKFWIIILLLLSITLSFAQNNPFTSGKNAKPSSLQRSKTWHTIVKWQKDLNQQITGILKEVKHSGNVSHVLILILISVLYGVIHAIGPGHGKMLVTAYFLKEKASVISTFKVGSIVAITHSGSSILLGILFGFFLKSLGMIKQFEIQNYISVISGGLIILLGLFYLWQKLFGKDHIHKFTSGKNEILLGIFAGIVPCPVSLTIILFSIYLDVFYIGLLSVAALSVGMAITISLIGIITIKSRHLMNKVASPESRFAHVSQKIVGVAASCCIILLGVILILAKV